jgi:hypothetical protein
MPTPTATSTVVGMADNDLFTGTESPRDGLDGVDPVAPPSEPFDAAAVVRRWWRDLTYNEVHAFIVGLVPWFLTITLASPVLLAVNVLLLVLLYLGVMGRVLTYVLREPHYYLAGVFGGWVLGASVLAAGRLAAAVAGVVV